MQDVAVYRTEQQVEYVVLIQHKPYNSIRLNVLKCVAFFEVSSIILFKVLRKTRI